MSDPPPRPSTPPEGSSEDREETAAAPQDASPEDSRETAWEDDGGAWEGREFQPIEARPVLPRPGEIVAKGKMILGADDRGDGRGARYTEVRLDPVRIQPSWDRSIGGEHSVGDPWPIGGYVLRFNSRGLKGGFRKLLPQTFSTVAEALTALARTWDIPDEALEHPRAYRIRKGLGGPPSAEEVAREEAAEAAEEPGAGPEPD